MKLFSNTLTPTDALFHYQEVPFSPRLRPVSMEIPSNRHCNHLLGNIALVPWNAGTTQGTKAPEKIVVSSPCPTKEDKNLFQNSLRWFKTKMFRTSSLKYPSRWGAANSCLNCLRRCTSSLSTLSESIPGINEEKSSDYKQPEKDVKNTVMVCHGHVLLLPPASFRISSTFSSPFMLGTFSKTAT